MVEQKDRITPAKLFASIPREGIIFIILALEIVVLAVITPDFFSGGNLINILRQASVIGIAAIGMTFVILLAGIDLSVGATVGLAAMLSALVVPSIGGWAGIPVMLLIGAIIGAINGALTSKLKVQPFIVTLAMMSMVGSLTLVVSNGAPVPVTSEAVRFFGTAVFGGIPLSVIVLIVTYLIAAWVLGATTYGRRLYAVGGAPDAARAVGIPVEKYIFSVYLIGGILAGVAAVFASGRLGTATPLLGGTSLTLDVIAGVIVGGTSLFGGVGSVWGTFGGVLIIAVLRNGLVMLGMNSFWQEFATGVVILIAVLLDMYVYSKIGKKKLRKVATQ